MLLILGIPLIGFVLYRLIEHYYEFNTPLFIFINGTALGPEWFWQGVTFMGDGLPAYTLMIFFCRKNAYLLWIGLLVALLIGLTLRLGRPWLDLLRPVAVLGEGQIHIIGQNLRHHSFPSGHSATAFALAYVLTKVLSKSLKGWLIIAAAIIAWSRVKVGAHWPFDVIVGSILGWYLAHLAFWLTQLLPSMGYSKGSQITLYSFATLCSLVLWTYTGGYPLAKPIAHTLSLLSLCFIGFIGFERSKLGLFPKRR